MDKSSGKKQLTVLVSILVLFFGTLITVSISFPKKSIEPVSDRWALIQSPSGWAEARGAANSTSLLLMQINNGVKVQLIEDSGNWTKIRAHNGRVGYVRRDFLRSL